MIIKMSQTTNSSRIIGILLWTMLPCLAIWLGMYQIKNVLWTFVLYHGICLLPPIIWGVPLWRPSFLRPSMQACATVILAALLFNCLAIYMYEHFGRSLLSDEHVLELLKQQGLSKNLFWPLSIFAIVLNPILEELFWRGVVLNELNKLKRPFEHFGTIWSTITYAAYHYLIFRLVLFPVWAELGIFLLAVFGAILALVYRRTGSILSTAMVHGLLTDMAVIVLVLDLFRRHPAALY